MGDLAKKYMNGKVIVKDESDLRTGASYNARMVMDENGHRRARKEMLESMRKCAKEKQQHIVIPGMDNYSVVNRRIKWSDGSVIQSVMDPIHCHEGSCCLPSRCRHLSRKPCNNKTGYTLGWSQQPRDERVLGVTDRRYLIPGYIGGVKLREIGIGRHF